VGAEPHRRKSGAADDAGSLPATSRQRLTRSFEQRVFFAGEATSRGEFSTAHGAYGSGVRAANEAIDALLPRRGRQAAGIIGRA